MGVRRRQEGQGGEHRQGHTSEEERTDSMAQIEQDMAGMGVEELGLSERL